jgi:hypothetical protein
MIVPLTRESSVGYAQRGSAIPTASSVCIAGMVCEQVSIVMAMVAWPASSETTLGWIPVRKSKVAGGAWCGSCGRVAGSFERLTP